MDLSVLKISEIRSRQCLGQFRCGNRDIDIWASDKALKLHQQYRARVFCARFSGNDSAIGFYSLSLSAMKTSVLPGQDRDKYKGGTAPLVYIDWLAVQKNAQSSGIGTILLMNAIARASSVSQHLPFYGLALRSLNDETTKLYARLGFSLRENSDFPIMIMPVWTILDLVKPSGM